MIAINPEHRFNRVKLVNLVPLRTFLGRPMIFRRPVGNVS